MHSGISFTYSNNYETNLVLTHNLHCVKIPGTESYFSPVININEKAKFAEKTLNSSHDLDFSLTLNKLMLHYYWQNKYITCFDNKLILNYNSFSNRIFYFSEKNLNNYNKKLTDFSTKIYMPLEEFNKKFTPNIKNFSNLNDDQYYDALTSSIKIDDDKFRKFTDDWSNLDLE